MAGEKKIESVEGDTAPAGSQPQKAAERPEDVNPAEELEKLTAREESEETTDEETTDQGTEDENEEETGDEEAEDVEPQGRRDTKAERRISELTAARKAAEEKAAAAEARAKELEARSAANVGLHPDYLTAEEGKLVERANALEEREEWLLRHWDGFEDEKDEKRNLTADQVREEYVKVRRETRSAVPAANALYERQKAQMLADMAEGRRIRLERERAKARATGKKDGEQKPPTLPSARGTTSHPPVGDATGRKKGQSEKRFVESGGSRLAAARELAELAGD
jgi:hypothetical protein